jgi:hypothetical protein
MACCALVLSLSTLLPFEDPAAPDARPPLAPLAPLVCAGASVSGGFGVVIHAQGEQGPVRAQVDLARVLRVAGGIEPGRVALFQDLMFFDRPTQSGPKLLAQALAKEPALIVGLDLLFWYGYGTKNRDGEPIASEDERLVLLGEGLAMFEGVECTLVLGDFPDMSAAAGGVLPKTALPRPETLAGLNDMLRTWAAERKNVIVLPLAELVSKQRAGEAFAIGAWEWPAGTGVELVQKDRLHPTLDGLIALAQLVVEELATRGLVERAAFRLERTELAELLRADVVRTAAAAQPQGARELVPSGR